MLTSLLKKIPDLQTIKERGRRQLHIRKVRALIKRLYPLSIDKEPIRFGPNGDGGYLIPDDLEGIHACFSPGVSDISGFEKDCADQGIKVFLADASVDKAADEHELFHFTKKFIGGTERDNFITLDDWVNSSTNEGSSDLMMQIDIEGDEYEVFDATSKALMQRFRIIVAEFHELDKLAEMDSDRCKEIFSVLNQILTTHSCVHLHPNNCCGSLPYEDFDFPKVMEFTFVRKDFIKQSSYQTNFPHPLDYNNTPNPTLELPKCWIGGNK